MLFFTQIYGLQKKQLLSKSVKDECVEKEFNEVIAFSITTHLEDSRLKLLSSIADKTSYDKDRLSIKRLFLARSFSLVYELLSQVIILTKLLICTAKNSERSFSSLKQLKNTLNSQLRPYS